MEVHTLQLFYHPKDRLRMTVADQRSYTTVKPVWASPLSYPGRYLSLMDGKGDEILTIPDVEELSETSRLTVREELARRYLTSQIADILTAKTEFGATYWTVSTERGEREFVTQSLQENAQWLSPTHLLLIDVDGNRFEIRDIQALPDDSRKRLFLVV